MAFSLIRISDLRNIRDCEISPHQGLNLIRGENGSGKTSLLEAVYILGRGRSFRDTQLQNLVQKGKPSFTIFGEKRSTERSITVGVRYLENGCQVRLNGERLAKLSLLAKETPIHVITPRSHEIIDTGSSIRRRFLEWGVFHVEPRYQYFSARYQRALSQRNMALKENAKSARLWDKELVESGRELTYFRKAYFEKLNREFQIQLKNLHINFHLDLALHQGWSDEKDLGEALVRGFDSDVKRRFTRFGPHRADLHFRVDKKPFNKWGSRGQMKMSIYALFFAQANVISLLSDKQPILLVDDFAAELDRKNVETLLDYFVDHGRQIFLTSSDHRSSIATNTGKMFHVEQGAIRELGV